MPRHRTRHDHVKVYRPNGARYANGESATWHDAVAKALSNYALEFGDVPAQHEMVIEVVGGHHRFLCTVWELN
jgi:hypothetical protein